MCNVVIPEQNFVVYNFSELSKEVQEKLVSKKEYDGNDRYHWYGEQKDTLEAIRESLENDDAEYLIDGTEYY